MADNDTSSSAGAAPAADAPQAGPRIAIRAQYIKDLSFENPRAPNSFNLPEAPKVDVQVSVGGRKLGETDHEILLSISAKAENADGVVFLTELAYAGIFTLENIPAEHLQTVLMVECPRMLFPFARRIVADSTRDGGYPPVMLEPVDFLQLYLRHQQQQQAGQTPAGTA